MQDKYNIKEEVADIVTEPDFQYSLFHNNGNSYKREDCLNVLSLFSGCGGMDIGFEGGFICNKKSIPTTKDWIEKKINDNWILLKKNKFHTIFANDILQEAFLTWTRYMKRFGYNDDIYHTESIVDLVKAHQIDGNILPSSVDIVTGGFPCQDFSVAGKRKGFNSQMSHNGGKRMGEEASEETRGKLYYWMKQVIDIVKPKIFIAENVKGLISLGDIKNIIQKDFASADDNNYYVFDPQILNAGNFGVPEMRERVIFIGVKKSALNAAAKKIFDSGIIPAEYNPYPVPTHHYTIDNASLLNPVTCADIFCDLKEPENSMDLSHTNYSKAKYMGNHCQGQNEINLNGLGPTIRSEHHGNIEYRRLSEEHGGKYLEELGKGYKERRLTPRECALIQTFPPDYPFVYRKGYTNKLAVSTSGAYKVIGNAVPPILAYNIAKRIEEIWPKYFE